MLLLWILLIPAALVTLKYLYLTIKRAVLLCKIKSTHPDALLFVRNPFLSVFVPSGKTDLIVKTNGKTYAVSILTTPFRRVRYHFNNEKLEIILERRAVYITNQKRPLPTASLNTSFPIKKYSLSPQQSAADITAHYMILHPAPKSVSAVVGTQIVSIENDDVIFAHTQVCGLRFFLNTTLK